MEEYIINLRMLVNTLGHKVFDDKRDKNLIQKQQYFAIKSVRGSDAQGEPTSDGFVVFKNSKASATEVTSISPSFINKKQELISKGILKLSGDVYEFTEDYIFSSPSSAAVIVMGRNANGPMEWKLSDGTTLKEFETNIK